MRLRRIERLFPVIPLLIAALAWPLAASAQQLDERCTAQVLNRTVQVNPDGGFALGNVPVPLGAFRVRVVCERPGVSEVGKSAFVLGVADGTTRIEAIDFSAADPIPETLELSSPATVLTPVANGAQLVATGVLAGGQRIDLTLASAGTFYLSSNPAIATVSADGFVTAVSSGRVLVTATFDGIIATIALTVALSDDSDGDGLPDDFEQLNSVNPGGSNLSLLPGTVVEASSFGAFRPERAIDGSVQTSWFTAVGDAANLRTSPFIEVILPSDQGVAQLRITGNRQNPVGFDIFAGIVQAFDAAGAEVLDSGVVPLPGPTRDLNVPIDLEGVRRVRFTATSDESNTPGLSEVQLLSRPGGPGLDPADPSDAAADFDLDGLSNLEEFALGTSIFRNDTDGDGLADQAEIGLGSSPLLADTDGDGVLDGDEISPTADSDGDGIINLLDADSDNDGLPDGVELAIGTSPTRADSNFNGIPDGSEDADGDGLANADEVLENTDPGNPDSDGDGLLDGEEVLAGGDGFITDPLRPDSDGDGMLDGYESRFGLDPTDPTDAGLDPDGDGLSNLEESILGTDPFNADTTPPQVAAITPADGATGHPVTNAVVVRFSEALRQDSIEPGVVRVFAGATSVAGETALSSDGLSLSFAPLEQFAAETLHQVEVEGIRDLAGNRLEGVFTSSFTTGSFIDTVRPIIVLTSPLSGETDVPVNAPFTIELSEPMDPATLTPANFTIRDNSTFANVAGMITVDASGRRASFVPDMPFGIGRSHSVTLSTSVLDVAGNALSGTRFFSFTTAFAADDARPSLVGTSPPDGAVAVPFNALVVLDFSEPLDRIAALRGIRIERAGVPVAGSFAFSNGNRRLTFTSAVALEPNASYDVVATTQVTDRAGNPLDNPTSLRFQTTDSADLVPPTVTTVDPANGATEVGRDVVVTIQFSERMNPLTVETSNFLLEDEIQGLRVAGTVSVAPDLLSATFVPNALLSPQTRYRVRTFTGLQDLTGRSLASTSLPAIFTTGDEADGVPPSVVLVSPPDGSADVPVNARVVVRFDEPLSAASVGPGSLEVTAAGTPVAAQVSLSSDRRELTLGPAAPLAASTAYSVAVSGVADAAGNAALPFSSSFTTAASAIADTTRPRIAAISPESGSSGVAVDSAVVFTFDEPVDPTTVSSSSMPVRLSGIAGEVDGSYAVSGAVVTFTPSLPLPGSRRIDLRVNNSQVSDLAGNGSLSFFSTFDTEAAADLVPPSVVLVTPTGGATGVGRNVRAVLTFSEPIDPATVSSSNFGLLAGGNQLSTSVSRSADNRTVTLSASGALPAESVVTVVATDDVADLAGNRLADFSSRFTTLSALDGGRPQVASQRPANGASDVPRDASIVLYATEQLDAATIPGALLVSENGVPVPGSVAITGNGRAMEFTPDAPLARGALVEIFLTTDARDVSGNALTGYQGSLRTALVTAGRPPTLVRQSPGSSATGVPTNVIIEAELSEPLDPATVDGTTVSLRQNTSGSPLVPATVSLARGGRVIRIVPDAPLTSNTQHFFDLTTGIRDLDGDAVQFLNRRFFTTGTESDDQAPAVTEVSPGDGAAEVGLNAVLRLRFDEPINPLSVTDTSVVIGDASGTLVTCTVSFSNGDRDVTLVPHAPLVASAAHMLIVDGVVDAAGNAAAPRETVFVTGSEPDTARPAVVVRDPLPGATGVAVNVVPSIEIDEPIDVLTVTESTFRLRDATTLQNVPGSVSVSADGRVVSFLPSAPLGLGRGYTLFFDSGIRDLSDNSLLGSSTSFTLAFDADTEAPQIIGRSPVDGLGAVPINGRVSIRFSEPVRGGQAVAGVTLEAGGAAVPVVRSLTDANRALTLTPIDPLAPSAEHTVTVAGIVDLAGNALSAPAVTTFTTETGADLVRPLVTLVDPANNAIDVPTNARVDVAFSERIDPSTVTAADFFLETEIESQRPSGTVTVAADLRSATFVPDAPLGPQVRYRVRTFSGIQDLTGQNLASTSLPATFTTGTDADTVAPEVIVVSPPDLALGVPTNVRIVVRFSEALSQVSTAAPAIEIAAAGVPVAGGLDFSSDRRDLIFTPASLLAPSSRYDVTVRGASDLAGNLAADFASSFTTAAEAGPDSVRPRVSSVVPANSAVDVPVSTVVVVSFDEPIDATTVSLASVPIRLSGVAGEIAGDYATDGAVVTFTPEMPLPGGRRIDVRVDNNEVRDLAGNGAFSFFSSFTTAAATDTTPPSVLMVTPPAGAVDVGRNASPVLTFSEPLDPATINSSNFGLLAGGAALSVSVSSSADNRTVTLRASSPLPAASTVTVVATRDVRDLAGNRLADFASAFDTGLATDTGRPSVASQRPANGASGVPVDRTVVLYTDEPLDPVSVPGALFVTADGGALSGTVEVTGNGRTLRFAPDVPFARGALVQVFVTSAARDVSGNALIGYQGSFRTVPETAGVRPTVVRVRPNSGQSGVALNAVIEAELSEPVDPATVDGTTVQLRQNVGGSPLVPATLSLRGGQVIRITPDASLAPSTSYFFDLTTGIRDLDGDALQFLNRFFFTTGTAADTTPPAVVTLSPADGAAEVALNGQVRVRFDEPINPLTVSEATIVLADASGSLVPCTISFSNGDRDIRIVPHAPMLAATPHMVVVDGVEDQAGNVAGLAEAAFTTGTEPDTARPVLEALNPATGATDVPTNVVLSLEIREPIDPLTVDASSFRLFDNAISQNVASSLAVSPDARTIVLLPDAALVPGRSYALVFSTAIRDLADNPMLFGTFSSFTLATAADMAPPEVLGASPEDGQTEVPTNVRVLLVFDEPLQRGQTLDAVSLETGGVPVPVTRTLEDANRRLLLQPIDPLAPATEHVVRVGGVADYAGNLLAPPVEVRFTTGGGADLVRPQVTVVDPAGGSTSVPTNVIVRIRFSERIDRQTVTTGQFLLQRASPQTNLSGTITVASDGLSATFTPDAALVPGNVQYHVRTFGGIQDLTGRTLASTSLPASFNTGAGEDLAPPATLASSPPDAAADVAVNGQVSVLFDEVVSLVSAQDGGLTVTAGGAPVAGTIGRSNGNRRLTWTPASALASSAEHTVTVDGVSDLAGNAAAPLGFAFTTATDTAADSSRPRVDAVAPANGAVGVDPATTIVFTFDEPIDPTTVSSDSLPIRIDGISGEVAGSYAVDGAVVTFTPASPLPAGARVRPRVDNAEVSDLAGNGSLSFQSVFDVTP